MNHSKVVIKLVEEMKRQNITIKLVTYGILIKGFGSMKNGGKVQEYYMELLESGL
jgi:pentatricopeptide repeat protein